MSEDLPDDGRLLVTLIVACMFVAAAGLAIWSPW